MKNIKVKWNYKYYFMLLMPIILLIQFVIISNNNISLKRKKIYLIKDVEAASNKYSNADFKAIIGNTAYPVGSIYISVDDSNPTTKFGGTWILFAQGKTMVGIDEADSDFNSVEKTGGEKKHVLTTSEIPAHDHGSATLQGTTWNFLGQDGSYGPGNSASGLATAAGDSSYYYTAAANRTNLSGKKDGIMINATHEHTSVGENVGHNNLMPYITVYMWKRTA